MAQRKRASNTPWVLLGATAAIVLFRSLIYLIWGSLQFDADQAIHGIMANDLAHLRAFPVCMYGQMHLVSYSVWLAAPFYWFLPMTVATLKIPMVIENLAALFLYFKAGDKDRKIPWHYVFIPFLFFLSPTVPSTSRLLGNSGGNIEPFVFLLLIWLWRSRPVLLGVTVALGYMNRTFVLYGVAALVFQGLISEGFDYLKRQKPRTRARWQSFGAFVATFLAIKLLQLLGTDYTGPGEPKPKFQGFEALWVNLKWLFQENLPPLFGGGHWNASNYVESRTVIPSWPYFFGAVYLVLAAVGIRTVLLLWRNRKALRTEGVRLGVYLFGVGFFTAAAFVCFAPSHDLDFMMVRYTLLCLLLPVGMTLAYFHVETREGFKRIAAGAIVAWAAANLYTHAPLYREYFSGNKPADPYQQLADHLMERGIKYGRAEYWTAYYVSYVTGEKVILSDWGFPRVGRYKREVDAHASESVTIHQMDASQPCPGSRILRWCVVKN